MSEPEAAPEAHRRLRSAREDLHMVRMALGDDRPWWFLLLHGLA